MAGGGLESPLNRQARKPALRPKVGLAGMLALPRTLKREHRTLDFRWAISDFECGLEV